MGENTTSSKRINDGKSVLYTQYTGTKESHDIQARQMNIKYKDGGHAFYNPMQGRQGYAGPNAERKSDKK